MPPSIIEVDDAILVLLVMMHQFDELIIVIAGNIQCTIEFLDEVYGLAHLLSRESGFGNTQIEFWNQAECHSVTMQDRLALQSPALKRMTESMPQVQRLADALLVDPALQCAPLPSRCRLPCAATASNQACRVRN